MITIKWTSNDDIDGVLACALLLGKDVSKLKIKLAKNNVPHKKDAEIKQKIKDKVK